MKTLKYFMTSYLLTLIVSYSALAQTAQHEQSFNFSDEFNNTQELILGFDPYGTDGLDPDLGEEFVAQVMPGNFGIRFQIPTDTSITTINDIRFGCGWPAYFEHLIDLSYSTGSSTIDVNWNWVWPTWILEFINPFNGNILATYEFPDSTHFTIPSLLSKIKLTVFNDGPLSWPFFILFSPNGGEIIEGGENYVITWHHNGQIPLMNIDFSADSGKNWILIEDSVVSTQNSYDWLVPNINSESCLIRIGDYPCAYNQSDSFFTITFPVSIEEKESLPTEFSLEQNYPNPFNPTTIIKFTIPSVRAYRNTPVQLKVYDVLGNEVATLINEEKPAGSYEVEFSGTTLPSGIYFYQLKAGSFIQTKKMILMK